LYTIPYAINEVSMQPVDQPDRIEGQAGAEPGRPGRSVEIFAALKQRILQWDYPPGHRFTEEELCRSFGVSRSPVREALRMLEESGLVERAPHRGCTVHQPNLQEINELYDVRLILECAAVELLARRGVPAAELNAMAETWRALARTEPGAEIQTAPLARQDRLFHESLARATGNGTLLDLLRTINDRIHVIRMIDITTVERLWETCRQHLAIVERVAARDPQGAGEAMRANIESARAQIEQALKDVLARAYFSHK
jgi:DNA-binding GntR family transcriptional regulator